MTKRIRIQVTNDLIGHVHYGIRPKLFTKTMTRIIRELKESDRADWDRLWKGYLDYYESSVEDRIYDKTFNRLIDANWKQQNALIAIDDGVAVGLVHFIYHAHNWREEEVCYLQDLYADPDHRGSGIGRDLIHAVYAAADTNGTPSVYWLTQDFNTAARGLYDKVAQLTPFIKYQR